MKQRWSLLLLCWLALAFFVGCSGAPPGDGDSRAGKAAAELIRDSAHGGQVPGFFFLPPFVSLPRGQTFGTFAPSAAPTVTVDQIVPATASSTTPTIIKSNVATFTSNGGPNLVDRRNRRAPEHIRVHLANRACDADDDDEDADTQSYFAVRWDTREANLVDGGVYRLRVKVNVGTQARELGFADVVVLRSRQKARYVDSATEVPLVNGRVLRVKFRIDAAALDRCLGVVCPATDACHAAGVCQAATGLCSNPAKPDGAACSDGNACTTVDACVAGACVGASPVTCTASDACHAAGVCEPSTGACSSPSRADGTSCDDGDACTRSDACLGGACVGANEVTCAALDQCHDAGECDSLTGACSNPTKVDGAACSDGNACTQLDTCQVGSCIGASPVVCTAADACHLPGVCEPTTGVCSNPVASACSMGNGGAGTLSTVGGTLTTDIADITVPTQAALAPLDVTVTPVAAPAALPSGVSAVGAAVDVHLGPGQVEKLNAPVIVKLKYPKALVSNPSKLAVLHFDGTRYEPTSVLAEDPVAGTLSIETRAFSPFQVVDFSGFSLPAASSVGFSAPVNGWNIQNFGSYFSPGGNCLGMAGYATWFFGAERPVSLNGHFSSTGEPSIAKIVATRAHLAQSQYWALQSSTYLHALGAARTATLMKFFLAAFGDPLVLLLEPTPGNPAHASVLYGYDQNAFIFYDVNHPNAEQRVAWNGTGWGTYEGYTSFSFDAVPTLGRTEDFAALTAEAEGAFASSSALTITNPLPGALIADTKATLAGRVSALFNGAAKVVAYSKGVPQQIPISGGAFSGQIPVDSGDNTVIVLAGVSIQDQSNWFLNGATRIFNVTGTTAQTKLLATLTWDQTASDVDLYGTDPSGATAWYSSKRTTSGLTLDFDNVTGLGPEHTSLALGAGSTVLPGDYVIRVHYYADHDALAGTQPITGHVTVVVNQGQPNQQVLTVPFSLGVASSGNSAPGGSGADWVNIAKVDIVNSTITPF